MTRPPDRCQAGSWTNPQTAHTLYFRLWEPPDGVRHWLILIHGFGEHGGRYDTFVQMVTEQGIGVACADLWGQGRSGGRRGDIERLEQYVDDLEAWVEHLLAQERISKPLSIFGHSLGGLLAGLWLLRRAERFACAVIQSPLLGIGVPVPAWKRRLADWIGRRWPTVALPIGLDPTWLSRDPAIVRAYRRDPLVHGQMTARCYHSLHEAMSRLLAQASQLSVPVLLLTGQADRVISHAACQRFFDALHGEKRHIAFPDCFHELHHEPVLDEIIRLIVQWLTTHA